jgi:tryptophan 2,3-dioxygenase
MTYGGYLALADLLSAQHPLSQNHDELLFIIIHQTKELWLKQAIRELVLSAELIRNDRLVEVHKALSRVSRIQAVMTLSWDVLATMTPSDYTSFREVLGASSGFQTVSASRTAATSASRRRARPPTPRFSTR